MNGQEPAITQQDPRAYYLYLLSQRMPAMQAVQMVEQRFGPPKTPDQRAREQAGQAQNNALAQTAGTIGGLLVTQQALQGFPALSGLFGSGASTGAVTTPTLLGAQTVGGTAGSTVATPPLLGAQTTAPLAPTAPGSTLGSVGSVALPAAVSALMLNNIWESGMKDIVRGRGNRADYANQAINMNPYTAPLNIGLRLLGKRSVGKMMTSGKSDAQAMRDDFRGLLKQTGVANDTYNVTLADGSQYNIGLDGKTKLQNVGENIDKKKTRQAWDVDFSNPLAQFAVQQIDPMIRNIYKDVDGKIKPEQYTGMLVNAATSNAKTEEEVKANINAMLSRSEFAKKAGVNLPPPSNTRQTAPVVNKPQVSVPEGKKESKSIRDILKSNMGKK
jgi:hypothetical protein